MAQPNILQSYKAKVWRGLPTDTSPPGFFICGLVTKGLQQTKQTNTAVIPDCDDPDIPSSVRRTTISKDVTMSGEGFFEPDLFSEIQAAYDSNTSLAWSFELLAGTPAVPEAVGWFTGNWVFSTFNITAEQGDFVRAEMAWEADGEIVFTPAALMMHEGELLLENAA